MQPTGTVAAMQVLERAATDVGASLAWYRHGRRDPTTWITRLGRGPSSSGHFVRATWTPDGAGTIHVQWSQGAITRVDGHGPGADWLADRVPAMTGALDAGAPHLERDDHPIVAAAARDARHRRIGASGTLYHELLPTIIEQRITAGEALRQWRCLCEQLGEDAPGPFDGLRLPPRAEILAGRPSWWFHPLGIERKRAEPLRLVATHADKFWGWAELPPTEAAGKLRLLRGVGAWTTGSVLGPALGDADAVPVGDFHIKNTIGWALAGEARATDERMLELLSPYAGQRGRVVSMLGRHQAPKFGPRKRVLPMARW
jgi:3-methyladenine DNA glycosylase/8-oxoguanine DNA glycosylase